MRKSWIPLCLLTAACSSFGSSEPSELGRQVEELKARVVALQQQAVVDQAELAHLRERLEVLESGSPAGRAITESGRGRGVGIEEESISVEAAPVAIEEADLEELPLVEVVPDRPPEADSQPEASTEVSEAAQELYDRGYTLYHQGRHLEAEESFTRFLAEFADSELADNAHYWIGESRLARGELQSALASFRDAVRLYPRGNKAPDALFKTGRVLEQLGDLRGARDAYLRLQAEYPLSPLTEQAQARLDRL